MIAPVVAMLEQLPAAALAELERGLRLTLLPDPTAVERRVRELGFLAELLEALPPGAIAQERQRLVTRLDYDTRRPPQAPQSARLVGRYGSWLAACRAADGLLSDGRFLGGGKPWPSLVRDRPKVSPYTRAEVRAAIKQCALELGQRPGANGYYAWVAKKKARARRLGLQPHRGAAPVEPRLPGLRAIYRLYPTGANRWARAVADAAITDAEIAAARRRRFDPGAAAVGAKQDAAATVQAVANRIEQLAPSRREFCDDSKAIGELPFSDAVAFAVRVGCSLDWLAGRSADRGAAPPPAARFDGDEFARRAREAGLSEGSIRQALGLRLGPYRRLLSGRDEPTLAIAAALAGMLDVSIDDCLTTLRFKTGGDW